MSNGEFAGVAPCVSAEAPGLHIPFNSRFRAKTDGRSARSAVFLDRDGVLVRDVHYLKEPSQIELLPYIEQLCHLQNRYYLVVATNQSGIARNLFTEDDLLVIHSELVERLYASGVIIDAFYYCPHLPDAVNPTYNVVCECRKPGAGLLRRAAAEWALDLGNSYMIGDSLRDIETGNAAGVSASILLGGKDVPDLKRAVDIILGRRR